MTMNNVVMRFVCALLCCLGLLALTGCQNPLATARHQDPYVAYLLYGATGRVNDQMRERDQIVQDQLQRRVSGRPASQQSGLTEWTQFVASLENPIQIPTDRYRNALRRPGVQESHFRVISEYIRRNPRALTINGAQVNSAWRTELEDARRVVSQLEGRIERSRQRASQATQANQLREAYSAMVEVLQVDPRNQSLRQDVARIQSAYAASLATNLQATVRGQVRLQRMSDAALRQHDEALTSRLVEVGELQRNSARLNLPIEPAATDRLLQQQTQRAQTEMGLVWERQLALARSNQNYWEAYQYVLRVDARSDRSLFGDAALDRLYDAYASLLPAAMTYWLEGANREYDSDRYGAAFVVSRMGREMHDYGISRRPRLTQQLAETRQLLDQVAQLSRSWGERSIERQVVFADFLPANYPDRIRAESAIRDSLRERVQGIVWATEIVAEAGADQAAVRYSARNAVFEIGQTAVREMRRDVVEVGTARTSMILNPNFKVNNDRNRSIRVQEVLLYPRTTIALRKHFEFSLDLQRERAGAVVSILSIDGRDRQLASAVQSLTLSGQETRIEPPLVGAPRPVSRHGTVQAESPPLGTMPALSTDREIRDAVIQAAAQLMIAAVQRELARFPVDELARTATGKTGIDAVDSWGFFLIYMEALGPPEENWLRSRAQLERRVNEWSRSHWLGQERAQWRDNARNAWSIAVRAYLAANSQ